MTDVLRLDLDGDRQAVREGSVAAAFEGLLTRLEKTGERHT